MTCNNCARHVTEAIQSIPEVHSASVSLANKSASVRWNSGATHNVAAIVKAVAKAGYEVKEIEAHAHNHHDHGAHHQSGWQINLLLGVVITAALMIGEWIF
ncbi:MAG: cation transporter [Limisphaerales bacterium]